MTTDGVNVRELSLSVLLAVEKEGQYSNAALSSVLEKHQYLTKAERGFLTRLTEGTLERQIELDYVIGRFSSVKVTKMKPAIRCILRMGAYQLKYMGSVPPSAACDEAVKLTAKKGFRNLKPFVNGVLRSIGRQIGEIPYPDEKEHPIQALSVRFSLPEWMLRQWAGDYGFAKMERIAEALQREGRICVRVNRLRTTPERLADQLLRRGIVAERAALAEYPGLDCAMFLSGVDYLSAIPEFADGLFFVQDLSSMLAAHIAGPKPGDYVIDVCAAPGGKSLHALECMNDAGMVEARDLTGHKVALIEENIRKSGMKRIRAVQQDARVLDEASVGAADLVLADLPCSGLGTLRRKTDIRFRMTREKEESLALLQREILSVACQYVKPGGVLLYSTCTMNRMENEENTAWFLEGHPEFSLVTERQIFPDEGELDGFYIAKLLRNRERA